LDTPLERILTVKLKLTRNNTTLSKEEIVSVDISSFASIRELKLQLEPFAYYFYLKHIETPHDLSGRNVRYFAHSTSIGDLEMESDDGNDSDEHSEIQLSPREEDDDIEERGRNYFLSAMNIFSENSNVAFTDTQPLYSCLGSDERIISCQISLDHLIYQ
jgi:hypothetical protein